MNGPSKIAQQTGASFRLLNFFISFNCDNCKILSFTYHFIEAEIKITCLPIYKIIIEIIKENLRVYMVLGVLSQHWRCWYGF